MEIMQELLRQRSRLLQLLETTDAMIEQCRNMPTAQSAETPQIPLNPNEQLCSLCEAPAFFKGKSVAAVLFPDGTRVEASTWKKFVEIIMRRCNSDPAKHSILMDMRDRTPGHKRQLLSCAPDKMRSPLMIDDKLYMESHYDTETLLKIMLTRILDSVEYDYHGIYVVLRRASTL